MKHFSPRRSAALFTPVACSLMLLTLTTGCTSKKYVRNQTTPVINGTNELDDKTASDTRKLRDLDSRTGTGINAAETSATNAQQAAGSASNAANQAQTSAQDAVHRASTLEGAVANLDTYHKTDELSVNFGFNKSDLTREAKSELDTLGSKLGTQQSYILSLTGGTDSVGSAAYNYQLSDRRAESVVQYLASKYGIPARRFYLIGLGEDVAVGSNATAKGRAENRRVKVVVLTNQSASGDVTAAPAPAQQ